MKLTPYSIQNIFIPQSLRKMFEVQSAEYDPKGMSFSELCTVESDEEPSPAKRRGKEKKEGATKRADQLRHRNDDNVYEANFCLDDITASCWNG